MTTWIVTALVPICLAVIHLAAPAYGQEEVPDIQNREVRGLIKSTRRLELRTGIIAPIREIRFRPGQSFAEGDLLYVLDCARHDAELSAIEAALKAAEIDLAAKQRLLRHKAIGRSEVQLAEVAVLQSQAKLEAQKAINKECMARAPFSGRVVATNAMELEYPPADGPLITIIDDRSLEIELVVPSDWLEWLEVGRGFSFLLDETAETVAAEITRIGAEIDPVSQTIVISGVLVKDSPVPVKRVIPGMSGSATFGSST